MWPLVLLASLGCYAEKLVGLLVPPRLLASPRARLVVTLVPVALLGALVATGTVADGRALVVDARAAGMAAAVGLLLLRAPFLVVVTAAVAVTAGVRALG